MRRSLMRSLVVYIVITGALMCSRPVYAQGPPPPIPLWVVDLHATVPSFPDTAALAASRDLQIGELPGVALGGDIALHLYPLRFRNVTFGVGGRLMSARAHKDPQNVADA